MLLSQLMVPLMIRLSLFKARLLRSRLARAEGESTTTGHMGYLVIALILVAMGLVFAFGPGKAWVTSIFNSVTSIQPPTMPSGS